jgi:hypothetical protein
LDDTDVKGQPNQTDHERLAMEENAAREESRMQVKKEWAEWMPAATNSYMEISPTYPDRLIHANGSSYTASSQKYIQKQQQQQRTMSFELIFWVCQT